jgi:hypothetical protein
LHIGKDRICAVPEEGSVRCRSTGSRSRKPCARRRTRWTIQGEALLAKFSLMDKRRRIGLYDPYQRRTSPGPKVKFSTGEDDHRSTRRHTPTNIASCRTAMTARRSWTSFSARSKTYERTLGVNL